MATLCHPKKRAFGINISVTVCDLEYDLHQIKVITGSDLSPMVHRFTTRPQQILPLLHTQAEYYWRKHEHVEPS